MPEAIFNTGSTAVATARLAVGSADPGAGTLASFSPLLALLQSSLKTSPTMADPGQALAATSGRNLPVREIPELPEQGSATAAAAASSDPLATLAALVLQQTVPAPAAAVAPIATNTLDVAVDPDLPPVAEAATATTTPSTTTHGHAPLRQARPPRGHEPAATDVSSLAPVVVNPNLSPGQTPLPKGDPPPAGPRFVERRPAALPIASVPLAIPTTQALPAPAAQVPLPVSAAGDASAPVIPPTQAAADSKRLSPLTLPKAALGPEPESKFADPAPLAGAAPLPEPQSRPAAGAAPVLPPEVATPKVRAAEAGPADIPASSAERSHPDLASSGLPEAPQPLAPDPGKDATVVALPTATTKATESAPNKESVLATTVDVDPGASPAGAAHAATPETASSVTANPEPQSVQATAATPTSVPLAAEPRIAELPAKEVPMRSEAPPAQISVQLPVGHERWSEALQSRVIWQVTEKIQQAHVQLNPPELGPVGVNVELNDGQAKVHFQAQHPSVRDALQESLPKLKEMFSEAGLTLTNADVSHWSSGQGQASHSGKPLPEMLWDENGEPEAARPIAAKVQKSLGLIDAYI